MHSVCIVCKCCIIPNANERYGWTKPFSSELAHLVFRRMMLFFQLFVHTHSFCNFFCFFFSFLRSISIRWDRFYYTAIHALSLLLFFSAFSLNIQKKPSVMMVMTKTTPSTAITKIPVSVFVSFFSFWFLVINSRWYVSLLV